MTSRCLECSDREQSGQFGLCDLCRDARRARVRASIHGDAIGEGDSVDQESSGQLSLADF